MNNNQYFPKGSYLLTSKGDYVTINAECEVTGGNWVQSKPITYSKSKAENIRDIANIEGNLKIFTSESPEPNPTDNLGPYVPAGSYQLTSRNVTVTINAECEQTGGNWVKSNPLNYSSQEASNFRDIANIEGELKSFKKQLSKV